jgi:hypothetical protein
VIEREADVEKLNEKIAALERKLDDLKGALDGKGRREALLKLQTQMMEATEGGLYAIRANLAQVIREVIEAVDCHPEGHVTIRLRNMDAGYRYLPAADWGGIIMRYDPNKRESAPNPATEHIKPLRTVREILSQPKRKPRKGPEVIVS